MERERAKGSPLLLLDTGGTFLRHFEDAANAPLVERTTAAMVEGLNAIGYDALNLGRPDLLLPPGLLARIASEARFPVLSANVVDAAGKAPFAGWVIREVGGERIGIFGISGNQKLPAPPGPAAGHKVQDPFAAARRAVAALRGRCRLVIALSQLGLEEDERLARQVPGIDLILGGYSRALTPAPRLAGSTMILHAGAKGMRIGRLQVELEPGSQGAWVAAGGAAKGAGRRFTWEIVPLDAGLPDSAALAALLERHTEDLRAHHLAEQEAANRTTPPPPATARPAYVGAQACGECHPEELRQWAASPHARAFAALERKRQDRNPECVRCHVTAYGDPGGYRPAPAAGGVDLANVQCEACHGFGRDHTGRGRIRGRVAEAICRRCHSTENSPTFKYEQYLRLLGPHARRFFDRPHEQPPAPAR